MNCNKCGTENSETAFFCKKCGGSLLAETICKKCGTENGEDAVFCDKCGERLKSAQAVKTALKASASTIGATAEVVKQATQATTEVVKQATLKKHNLKKPLLLGGAALVICLGIIAVVLLSRAPKIKVEFIYDLVRPFSEGFALVEKDGQWGYINTDGDMVISLLTNASFCGNFSEGLAAVNNGDKKYGAIDKSGNVVIPYIYDYMRDFSEGLAVVLKDDKYGYINKNGREVIPIIYDRAWSCSDGILVVLRQGEGYGYIDKNGSEIIPCMYSLVDVFSEDLAWVLVRDKYGYIDKSGNEVIPFNYDSANSFTEGLASVKKDGKYGYIDKSGNEVIPFIYDYALSFTEGLASVVKDGKYGYIDKSGNEVIPFIYDGANSFSDGLASVVKNGKCGYIDKSGNEVIPLIYDRAYSFSDGLAFVQLDGKYGLIASPLLLTSEEIAALPPEERLVQAEQAYENGDMEKAYTLYMELLQELPEEESVYASLASIFIKDHDYDAALVVLEVGYAATGSAELDKMHSNVALVADFGEEAGQMISDGLEIVEKFAKLTDNEDKLELGMEIYNLLRVLK